MEPVEKIIFLLFYCFTFECLLCAILQICGNMCCGHSYALPCYNFIFWVFQIKIISSTISAGYLFCSHLISTLILIWIYIYQPVYVIFYVLSYTHDRTPPPNLNCSFTKDIDDYKVDSSRLESSFMHVCIYAECENTHPSRTCVC